jgi:hypothetical protein
MEQGVGGSALLASCSHPSACCGAVGPSCTGVRQALTNNAVVADWHVSGVHHILQEVGVPEDT